MRVMICPAFVIEDLDEEERKPPRSWRTNTMPFRELMTQTGRKLVSCKLKDEGDCTHESRRYPKGFHLLGALRNDIMCDSRL